MSINQGGQVEFVYKRPHVSVCMAAYNGERYLRAQLTSILEQLDPSDEVIIVDDCSIDKTCELISSVGDSRIRLIRHKTNSGVKKTFEDAIRNAAGEILFLSDQDDIWESGKVSKVCSAFERDRDAQIVASGFRVIDDNGNSVYDAVYSNWPRFHPGMLANIWSNRLLGSTMAIRASLVPQILPFPIKFSVEHDAWIMAINTVTGGKVAYLDESLLLYRRHQQNVSVPLAWGPRIKKRLHLVGALLDYSVKRKFT